MLIWQHKGTGQWLVIQSSHTHTGRHLSHSLTTDINEATPTHLMDAPRDLRREEFKAVQVTMHKIIVPIAEEGSDDYDTMRLKLAVCEAASGCVDMLGVIADPPGLGYSIEGNGTKVRIECGLLP